VLTNEGMFCGNAFGKFDTLLELAWVGIPFAAVFVLAISASAFRTCDVSCVGAPAVMFPFAPVSGMKSFGGDTVGVVDRGSTENERYQKEIHNERLFSIGRENTWDLTIRSWRVQLLLESSQQCSRKCTTTLPNIKEFHNPSLLRKTHT